LIVSCIKEAIPRRGASRIKGSLGLWLRPLTSGVTMAMTRRIIIIRRILLGIAFFLALALFGMKAENIKLQI